MRMSRWRPVCPECGYSLRGLTSDRCPECGAAFPTTNRLFRRWAFQRLPWDRRERGYVPGAYSQTFEQVLLHPAGAATGLVHPDHWRRALRWAALHILIAACAGAFLGHNRYFFGWVVERLRETESLHPYDYLMAPPPAGRVVMWYLLSALTWAAALAAIPACGMMLSMVIPGRHQAARLAGVKLSLYLSALLPVLLGLGFLYRFWFHLVLNQWLKFQVFRFPDTLPDPLTKVTLLAAMYGLWWAIGLAANPYGRSRGWRGWVRFAVVFWSAWIILARVLFPAGALVTWL